MKWCSGCVGTRSDFLGIRRFYKAFNETPERNTVPNAPTPDEAPDLKDTLDQLMREMSYVNCDSDEYAKMTDQLTKLYSLKEIDSKRRISPDTLAIVIGNLAGIVLIVGHERMNVVTSKALNFILKLR
jgi:hypothetical protein